MIALVGVAGFIIGLMVPAGYAALHSVIGAEDRALGIAVAFFFLNLIGYGAGPAAIGLLSDAWRPRYGDMSIALALGGAILALIPAAIAFATAAWTIGKQSRNVSGVA